MMTSTFSALLAICAGNPGEFPTQRPVTRSFDVYFDLRPNKRLSKQSWGWWFETQSRPLWRHRNVWGGSSFTRPCLGPIPMTMLTLQSEFDRNFVLLSSQFWSEKHLHMTQLACGGVCKCLQRSGGYKKGHSTRSFIRNSITMENSLVKCMSSTCSERRLKLKPTSFSPSRDGHHFFVE